MDRFDEQAWRTLGDIYRETGKANALEEDKIARKVIAAALRETWNAAIEECLFACVAKNHDGSIGNLVQHVRSLKSTPPRTNDATIGRATRSGDA